MQMAQILHVATSIVITVHRHLLRRKINKALHLRWLRYACINVLPMLPLLTLYKHSKYRMFEDIPSYTNKVFEDNFCWYSLPGTCHSTLSIIRNFAPCYTLRALRSIHPTVNAFNSCLTYTTLPKQMSSAMTWVSIQSCHLPLTAGLVQFWNPSLLSWPTTYWQVRGTKRFCSDSSPS
jgi:hypothetical protein